MSTPPGKFTVLAGKKFACVKVTARANFELGIDFQTLVNELHKSGYTYVVMDLSECALMDSTFLGVLTGFGLKMSQTNVQSAPCVVELLNPNARISELLENLGVIHLFKICNGPFSAPEHVDERDLKAAQTERGELTRTCLEAHQTLMALNADNAARFKDVAHFLAEELRKQKDTVQPGA
jgi:anti-anti-sigma regulatory factor